MEKRVSPLRVRRVRRAKKKKERAADMTCHIPTRHDYSGERACTSTRRAGVLSERGAPRRRRTSRFSTRDIFNAARRRARERRSGRVGIRRTTRTRRLISDATRTRKRLVQRNDTHEHARRARWRCAHVRAFSKSSFEKVREGLSRRGREETSLERLIKRPSGRRRRCENREPRRTRLGLNSLTVP